MLIDNTPLYDKVWDRVYKQLRFRPDGRMRGHSFNGELPFEIDGDFAVYGIENMSAEHTDALEAAARKIFISAADGGLVYALDWQHSAFLYDPRNPEEQKDLEAADERYTYGGYTAYFPSFYPDGDYYFFIDENFRFGFLGHPWRQEVWIFGQALLSEFERIYPSLGWTKLK